MRPPVPPVPVATTPVIETSTVSLVSGSATVRVPDVERPALVSLRPAEALSVPMTLMSGASLVPVMVMVTLCVSLPL